MSTLPGLEHTGAGCGGAGVALLFQKPTIPFYTDLICWTVSTCFLWSIEFLLWVPIFFLRFSSDRRAFQARFPGCVAISYRPDDRTRNPMVVNPLFSNASHHPEVEVVFYGPRRKLVSQLK